MNAISTIIYANMIRGMASFVLQTIAAIAPTAILSATAMAWTSAITLGLGIAAVIAGISAGVSAINSISGENVNNPSGGGGNGINIPTNKSKGSETIQISLVNENTTYVGGQKMSQFNTEQQKTFNTRTS